MTIPNSDLSNLSRSELLAREQQLTRNRSILVRGLSTDDEASSSPEVRAENAELNRLIAEADNDLARIRAQQQRLDSENTLARSTGGIGSSEFSPERAGDIARRTQVPLGSSRETDREEEEERGADLVIKNIPNPISRLQTATYHWEWFMLPEIKAGLRGNAFTDFLNNVETIRNPTSNEVKNNISGENVKIVLAETGYTIYNINSVELESMVGPNFQTKNTNSLKFKMNVLEPGGISLVDTLLSAGRILLTNPQKGPYFLRLRFFGETEDGDIKRVGTTYDSPREWIWRVSIIKLESTFGPEGSSHDIELVPFNQSAFNDGASIINKQTKIEANTVGEFFKQLELDMAKFDETKYGISRNVYKFLFRVPPADINGGGTIDAENFEPMNADKIRTGLNNIENWTFREPSTTDQERRGDSLTRTETGGFSIKRGTSIESIVNYVFANTKEAYEINNSNRLSEDSKQSSKTFLAQVRTETQILGTDGVLFKDSRNKPSYDVLLDDYNREYTWIIVPYVTRNVIKDENAVMIKDNKDEQLKIMRDINEELRLRKVYDYYFTGLNTEIINFDVKFNTTWLASLALYEGRINRANLTIGGREQDKSNLQNLINKSEALRLAQIQKQKELNEKKALLKTLSENQNREEGAPTSEELQNLQIELNTAESRLSDTTSALGTARNRLNIAYQEVSNRNRQTTAENIFGRGSEITAEELVNIDKTKIFPINVSLDQSDEDDNIIDDNNDRITDPRQSLYANILNQVQGPVESNFMKIDLEIKGDPYWIGNTNTQDLRRQLSYNGSREEYNEPGYDSGSEYILFRFNLPNQIDDDPNSATWGSPVLQKENTFTGIYMVLEARHTFKEGGFQQNLKCVRAPHIDVRELNIDLRG